MTALPNRTRLHQLQQDLASGQLVRLYGNDRLPLSEDTGAEYREIMSPGYAAQSLTFEDWNWQTLEAREVGFLFLQPPFVPIYGYFLTERVTGRFLWADAFVDLAGRLAPITPSSQLFELYVTPCLRLDAAEQLVI